MTAKKLRGYLMFVVGVLAVTFLLKQWGPTSTLMSGKIPRGL